MKIALFTNARDESHLKEWVAHHLLIGFDNIIIFDHKSKVPIQQEFQGFDKRVRVINCSQMEGAIKMPLMMFAVSIAKSIQVDWMLYLDADEFVVLNSSNVKGIKHFLQPYSNIDQLATNWLMFGTSNLLPELNLKKGECILDSYTRSDIRLNNHVKCFVRPNQVIRADNPHFFHIRNPSRAIGINGTRFSPPFHDVPLPFYKAPIFIAHYVYQSEETYRKRKLNIPRDDDGTMRTMRTMRTNDNIKHIHEQYNERDNFFVAHTYARQVKAFLTDKGVIQKTT